MDYSSVGENGEPTIVRIDNEEKIMLDFVAESSFLYFIYMVYRSGHCWYYIEIDERGIRKSSRERNNRK